MAPALRTAPVVTVNLVVHPDGFFATPIFRSKHEFPTNHTTWDPPVFHGYIFTPLNCSINFTIATIKCQGNRRARELPPRKLVTRFFDQPGENDDRRRNRPYLTNFARNVTFFCAFRDSSMVELWVLAPAI